MAEIEIDYNYYPTGQFDIEYIQNQNWGIISKISLAFQDIRRNKLAERNLIAGFDSVVGSIALSDVAVNYSEKPISQPEKFGFIAIKGKLINDNTMLQAQDSVQIPSNIRCTYRSKTRYNRPYLDAGLGVGLTYDEHLIAVSSAGLDRKSSLKIVQIQDVTSVSKLLDGKKYYQTGLHNGLAWRETLVKSWELIAHNMGINKVVIQSNSNNHWNLRDRTITGYDETAAKLGYTKQSHKRHKGNWEKAL